MLFLSLRILSLLTPRPSLGIAQASPISAHIRIPIEWYHSATFSFFPDETTAMIRRVYENPFEGHTRRHFCGFCGTPLTYWSDQPRGESNYIHVTMGSLCREDLGDLEEMGLIPETPTSPGGTAVSSRAASRGSPIGTKAEGDAQQQLHLASPPTAIGTTSVTVPVRAGRETTGIPWFDTMLEGSRLSGRIKTTKGSRQSADGTTRVEWEVVEYTDDTSQPGTPASANNGKRKLGDRDDADDTQMDGISQ